MNAVDAIALATETVGYLRATTGPRPDSQVWIDCAPLVGDPDALATLARSTAAGRGTDRDDVATSLFVQAYSFRIAGPAIGAWLLADTVVDLTPDTMAIALGRDRANAVHFDAPTSIADGTAADPDALHRALVDDHLGRLVATAHDACRIGEALLWSNVSAGIAAAFGAFMAPRPDRHEEIRSRLDALLAVAGPMLAASGQAVEVGRTWAWERNACCLWYKTESGSRCEDCSLWTAAERSARYASMRAEQEA